ncbi:MAG: glycosyltransferase family 4 protein [Candidatus Zixiibacteriota bacterium]
MNILFLDSIEKETYGGMEKWIRLTAEGLAKRGHNVTVAGRAHSEFLRRTVDTCKDIRILELSISGDFNPVTITKLRKFLSKENIDVMTVNFNKDLRLGGLAARLDGGARVIWSVGLDITKNSFVHRFLTPKLIDGVIVPSHSLKNQITKYGYINPETVEVIPLAKEERDFVPSKSSAAAQLKRKYNLPQNSMIVVTVGRFVEQKGHIYLIEAATEIVAAHPNVFFLLLGDGPLRKKLKARIAELSLDRHFMFAGMLDDVDGELAGADLMIHPSVEEPFGNALIEGMSAGLPIIASRVGGIPEVVIDGQTALLVEPRQPQQLAKATLQLLNSPSRREAFGLAGQERCRSEFDLKTMIDRIEKYLMKFIDCGQQL